jgi:hypothetical protein
MGNRSKFVAVTASAVGAGALVARRRARLRHMAEGIRDTVLPTHVMDLPTDRPPGADEAHAPGHQHLPSDDVERRAPRRLRGRPWTKHAHGMRHPYAAT